MTDIKQWFQSLPIFTRYWLGLTAALSLVGRFEIIDPNYLVITYETVVHKFQIWRLVTCLFFYPINSMTGIHFLFNCYFLYNYSLRLETGLYQGRPADYSFLLLFNWLCCVIAALMFKFYFIMDSAVMTVTYIWCQLNKEIVVNFWFGTNFKAMYLPWVLFIFNLIINGRGMQDLVGIIVGHLFFFLMFQYPQEFNGPSLLSTPSYLYKLFPNERVVSGFGQTPMRRGDAAGTAGNEGGARAEPRGRHQWGQGQMLGGR